MNILLSINGAVLENTSSIVYPDITINLKSTKDQSVVDVSFTTEPQSFMELLETLNKDNDVSVVIDGKDVSPGSIILTMNELMNRNNGNKDPKSKEEN